MRKIILILIAFHFFSSFEMKCDQIADTSHAAKGSTKFIRRLVPTHIAGQFAGGIGMISLGPCYKLSNRLNLDLLYGHVPAIYSIDPLHIATVRATYSPLKQQATGKFMWKPLYAGIYLSYTFGDQFFLTDDLAKNDYPTDYYEFSTALRAGISLGTSICINQPEKFYSGLEGYFDLSTNDLYFVSMMTNLGEVSFFEILVLGIGVRVPVGKSGW